MSGGRDPVKSKSRTINDKCTSKVKNIKVHKTCAVQCNVQNTMKKKCSADLLERLCVHEGLYVQCLYSLSLATATLIPGGKVESITTFLSLQYSLQQFCHTLYGYRKSFTKEMKKDYYLPVGAFF